MVTPVQWAMRRTVRDHRAAGLLHPRGHQRDCLPRHEPPVAEIWTIRKVRSRPLHRAANEHKKHRYAFTQFGGGAHKCIGMAFGQLRSRRSCIGCCASIGSSCRCLATRRVDYGGMPVPMDGADRAPSAALTRFGAETQPPVRSRFAQASPRATRTASGRPDQPIAHCRPGPSQPRRTSRCARRPAAMKRRHLDCDAAVVEHLGQRRDRSRTRRRTDVPMRSRGPGWPGKVAGLGTPAGWTGVRRQCTASAPAQRPTAGCIFVVKGLEDIAPAALAQTARHRGVDVGRKGRCRQRRALEAD